MVYIRLIRRQPRGRPEIHEITAELELICGSSRTEYGSGGMATKLAAARICMSAGCATLIANGLQLDALLAVENGGLCTWFLPNKTPLAARKQWIAGTLTTRGTLTIDAGAEHALSEGKSLLPVGVVAVDGQFGRGDAVSIKGSSGRELGRGLAAYDSDEAQVIRGQRSQDIEPLLGYRGRDEIIHRDNLVLLDG